MHRPADLTDEEFDLIEENIARTAKGRAFLRRFARRATGAASDEVRTLLGQVRDLISDRGGIIDAHSHIDVLRRELMDMAASIERARREISALRPADETQTGNSKIITATNELDAIVTSTERASLEILNSAERLMDLTEKLRRLGTDAEICSEIEAEVTNIFTACSFQDLTGQRTSKVVNALRYIEQRVAAMISIWGIEGLDPMFAPADENVDTRPDAHLLSGPQLEGQGVSQDDVDRLFGGDGALPTPAPVAEPPKPKAKEEPAPKPAPKPAPEPAPAASGPAMDQSAIDALFN